MKQTKLRALVVHQSLTIRMDVAEALEALGFESHACASFDAAQTALENRAAGASLIVLEAEQSSVGIRVFVEKLRSASATADAQVLFLAEAATHAAAPIPGTMAEQYLGVPYDAPRLAAYARALLAKVQDAGAAKSSSAQGRRILVIDDSLTYRNQVKEALQEAGYEVSEATTGEEGLLMLAGLRPDALVVDGVLPGMDGATVVRRVKLDMVLRSIPCLLLTAAEGAEDELRSLEAGADAYVRKSEDLDVILARLVALLRHASAAETLPTALLQQRVLAVDDSATYLALLGEQLGQEGYEVILAESGEQAIDLLKVNSVDCILLDLIMPGLSGQETCRRIKATPEWRDVPLMLLTAQDDRDAMIAGINAGADDYIAKSADFDVLKARLRAQLRRKQFEDESRRVRDGLVRREAEISYTRALEQANRDLGLAKEHAEQSSRFKSSFLANMSHELRTPLNAIIGFAELLYDGQVPADAPEHREFLGDILTSGRHLQQLINDVLDLSKVEAGKLEFHPEQCSLKELVIEVLTTLRANAGSKKIRIETDLDASIDGVFLDPARLKQVLYNYVSNALKFTPEDGCITVATQPANGGQFRLAVKDTGIGIAAADVDRLFTEFEQLDAGAAKKHAGTGLGLALTKRLAEAQGGSVGVASTLGVGSTFHATMPRHALRSDQNGIGAFPVNGANESVMGDVSVISTHSLPSPQPLAPNRLGTVLVVDDDPSSSRLMAATLSQLGYQPVCVYDPNQGLSIAETSPPALIVLDLLMPGMNGFEFLDAVHQRPNCANVPVLLWTSKDLSASEYERLSTPAVAVLQKGRGTGAALLEEMRAVLKHVGGGG